MCILFVIAWSMQKPSRTPGQFTPVAMVLDFFMILYASRKLSILHSDEALASCRPKETAPCKQ